MLKGQSPVRVQKIIPFFIVALLFSFSFIFDAGGPPRPAWAAENVFPRMSVLV